jgi:hypothetical protein
LARAKSERARSPAPGRGDGRVGDLDLGLLQLELGVDLQGRGLLLGQRGLGVGDGGLVVARIDPRQNLAGRDPPVVLGGDLDDIARDLGGHEGQVAAHIGVVGASNGVSRCQRP